MIIKEKIIIEVDSPCIFGYTYSYDDCVKMMVKISNEEVSGNIIGLEHFKDKSFYKIINPQMIVDINDDNRTMYVIGDVEFDDKKYTKEELKMLEELPWRLAIEGDGDVDKETNIVKNYELKKIHIEIIPKELYNELNS